MTDYIGRFGFVVPQEHRPCFDEWVKARDEGYIQSRTAGGDPLIAWRQFESTWPAEKREQLGITAEVLQRWDDEFGY